MFEDDFKNENYEGDDAGLDELISTYEHAITENQSIHLDHEAYEKIIDFYEDNHSSDKALLATEYAALQYPYSATFMIRKAQLYIDLRRFDEANALLNKAEILDGEDMSIYLTRADLLVWQGKHHEAIKLLKDYIDRADDEDKEDLYLELADIYEDCERYDRVVFCLKQAIEQNPKSDEALNRLWFCTELLENYDDMVEFYKMLLDRDPYLIMAWFNIAHCYAGLDLWEKSIEAFEFVIAIDDKFEDAYVDCADIYFTLKQYKKAIELYKNANTLSRVTKEVYFQIGLCYEKLKEYNRARTYYRKSLTVDAEFDDAFYRIGECYKLDKRYVEALSSLERALKLYPDNVFYLKAIAEVYIATEEIDSAINIFDKIIEIDGSKKWQWIDLASTQYAYNRKIEAIETLDIALSRFKKIAELLYAKSALLYDMGRKNESLENLQRALSIKFKHHSLIFGLNKQMKHDTDVLHLIEQYKS